MTGVLMRRRNLDIATQKGEEYFVKTKVEFENQRLPANHHQLRWRHRTVLSLTDRE